MRVDDKGSYASLLESLSALIEAIHPSSFKRPKLRKRASDLKSILKGVADYCEAHAVSQRPGLARVLFTEISGHAGLPIFRRFDAALMAASATVGSASAPAAVSALPPRREGPAVARRPGFGRLKKAGELPDPSAVLCFGCRQYGHYRNACPVLRGQEKK